MRSFRAFLNLKRAVIYKEKCVVIMTIINSIFTVNF